METSLDAKSDDDHTIPDLQLSSVTQALLARHQTHGPAYGSESTPLANDGADCDHVKVKNNQGNHCSQNRPRRPLRITSISRNRYSTPRINRERPDDGDGDDGCPTTGGVTGTLHQPPRRPSKRSTPASVPGDEVSPNHQDEDEVHISPAADNSPSRASEVNRHGRASEQFDNPYQRCNPNHIPQNHVSPRPAETKKTSVTSSFRFSPRPEQQEGLTAVNANQKEPIANVPQNGITAQLPSTERVVPIPTKRKP